MPLEPEYRTAPSRAVITELMTLYGPMTAFELSACLNCRRAPVDALLRAMARDGETSWAGTYRGGECVHRLEARLTVGGRS